MDGDVLIIGGGAAGLAAALQLGRARRSVVVVDAGEPRNAPANHMHGYLGHEGVPPAGLLAVGRGEVRRYGVRLVEGTVDDVVVDGAGFQVTLGDGTVGRFRRVLVATGLSDILPDVPGVAEHWGRGVIHCPYCHGWEVRDQALVVVATGVAGPHQAALFRQWSEDITLVVHEGPAPDPGTRQELEARGVVIVEQPAAEVVASGDQVSGVRLVDGTVLAAGAVIVGPRFVARSEALRSLAVDLVPDATGMGLVIAIDGNGMTTVPGVYAAGNAVDVRHQVIQAAAEGSRIATVINADLVAEDTSEALDRPLG